MISPFSCNGLRAGRLSCLHEIIEWPDRNSTNRPRNLSSWGSGRNFDFCYCSGVKTQPLTEINRFTATNISLIDPQRLGSDACKPLYMMDFHLTVTKIKFLPEPP